MIDLLIDTNVLIYALDKSSVHHHPAKTILTNAALQLFVTTKNLGEFFAVTSKLKLSPHLCLEFYDDVRANTTTLFPTETSLAIFEKLIRQYHPTGNQVYDIEIVSIMIDNGIKHIATFNQKDFINISQIKLLEL